MTSHPDTSPPEPLTADVRDAAQAILDGCRDCDNNRICPIELNVILNEHSETVARALLAIEQHAEAMAGAIGREKVNSMPRDVAIAFAEYRIAFPRPRAEKDATHG